MTKTKLAIYCLTIIVAVSIILNAFQYSQNNTLATQNSELTAKQEMTTLLTEVQSEVNTKLKELDLELQAVCQSLSNMDLESIPARSVLIDLFSNNSLIVNAAINVNDVLVAVEPNQYRSSEGQYVGEQEQCVQMHQTMRPAMSNVIPLVEGIEGVVIIGPVFDANKRFTGAVSIVIEPSNLVNKTIKSITNSSDYTFMAIQPNGRVLYDIDRLQIGAMTLTDPAFQNFPQLLAICQKMAEEKSGYGTYEFNTSLASTNIVKKELFWETIGIYDTEWRLAIIHRTN